MVLMVNLFFLVDWFEIQIQWLVIINTYYLLFLDSGKAGGLLNELHWIFIFPTVPHVSIEIR